MNAPGRARQDYHTLFAVLCMVVLQIFVWLPDALSEPLKPAPSREEKLRLGERMYREGILPSGEPMQAFVKGDMPVPGTAFTCVSCHQRSGLGSVEGGVSTPATNWPQLLKPLQMRYVRFGMNRAAYFPVPVERPPYTDETLAYALRTGVDPRGRTMEDVMPRYLLDDEDMALMIFYLKSLSSEFSPGVSDTTFKFATVMTDDVSKEDRDTVLGPLLDFVKTWNVQSLYVRKLAESGKLRTATVMVPPPTQSISLSQWLLKGPPETWRSQLEDYYRRDPVFALIGGITKGEWTPIHQFSEDNHIPCLFPMTDFPVISRTDWYTMYLSKGYYQEGEAAAHYLNNSGELLKGRPIVQIVRDSREGKALQSGFQETWQYLGHEAPVTITLKQGKELTRDIVQKLLAREKPGAIVLWDGPAAPMELETLARAANRPEMVLVSSSYLGRGLWALKEQVRDFTYIAYPFRLEDKPDQWSSLILSGATTREANHAYAIREVLTTALTDMRGNYYRDNFLDAIGMMDDLEVPLYVRLSFGPGQRYASKGCYIVQLSKGDRPQLLRKSDWVIY